VNDHVIHQAIEKAGVEFIDADKARPWVRLRNPQQTKTREPVRRWRLRQYPSSDTSSSSTIAPAASPPSAAPELMPSATALTRVNDHVIRQALEAAEFEFIDADKGGPGGGREHHHHR
jgi:hypothetical protein